MQGGSKRDRKNGERHQDEVCTSAILAVAASLQPPKQDPTGLPRTTFSHSDPPELPFTRAPPTQSQPAHREWSSAILAAVHLPLPAAPPPAPSVPAGAGDGQTVGAGGGSDIQAGRRSAARRRWPRSCVGKSGGKWGWTGLRMRGRKRENRGCTSEKGERARGCGRR